MSSIYGQLSQTDLKIEQEQPALIPTPQAVQFLKPRLTGFKVAIAFSYFLGAAALMGVAYLFYALEAESLQRESLESSHVTLSGKTSALQAYLEEQKAGIKAFETRLNEVSNQHSAVYREVRQNLDRHRFELMNLQKKIKVLEEREQAMAADTGKAEQETQKEDTESIFKKSLPAGVSPSEQPAEGEARPEGRPVMGPQLQTSPAPAARAAAPAPKRILSVNRKFNFVVANLGSEDAVSEGSEFLVTREGKEIGKIQVEKLYEGFSAAAIVEEEANSPMEVGDLVQKVS